jgi:hypothetical protein
MKKTIAMMMILAGGLFAAPRIQFGIGFGAPAAPVAVVRPACPGPGYTWVDGYYTPAGGWIAGYWAPPAVVTVAPSYGYAPHFDRDDHARFDRDGHFDRGSNVGRNVGRNDRGGNFERSNFNRGGNSDHGRR